MLRIDRLDPPHADRLFRRGAVFGFALLIVLLQLPTAALADELVIEGAWIRLPPPGANTAGYMTLVNDGDAPIRLTGVSSDSVERVELHESSVEGGVARMRHIHAIDIPAHGRVSLAPRGLHLMLIRPETLVEGATVRLVLELDGGATQTVDVPVRRESAKP